MGRGRPLPCRRHTVDARGRLPLERRSLERALAPALRSRPRSGAGGGRLRRLPSRPVRRAQARAPSRRLRSRSRGRIPGADRPARRRAARSAADLQQRQRLPHLGDRGGEAARGLHRGLAAARAAGPPRGAREQGACARARQGRRARRLPLGLCRATTRRPHRRQSGCSSRRSSRTAGAACCTARRTRSSPRRTTPATDA